MTYAYCYVNSIMKLYLIAHFLSLTSSLKPFNFLGLSLHLHPLSWATCMILLQVRRSLLQSPSCLYCVHLFQCTYLFQSIVILIFIEIYLLSWLARRSLLCSSHGHLFHCAFLSMVFMIFMIYIDISIRKKISFALYRGHLFHCTFLPMVFLVFMIYRDIYIRLTWRCPLHLFPWELVISCRLRSRLCISNLIFLYLSTMQWFYRDISIFLLLTLCLSQI